MTDLFQEVNETPEAQPVDIERIDAMVDDIRGTPIQPGDLTAVWFRDRYGYADTKGGVRLMKEIVKKDSTYRMIQVFDGERTIWALRKLDKVG